MGYVYKSALVERWGGWNQSVYLALCSGPTGCTLHRLATSALHCQCAVLLGIGSPFSRLELDYIR